ncbi:MAG: TolC family protein [Nitrospiraceae bacterium]|nr:TolC family protein [Nitrospiraceae bacterium]
MKFFKTFFAMAAVLAAFFCAGNAYSEVLTISEGLKLATRDNRLVKIARDEEKIARSDTRMARAPMLPSVNAAYDQTFLASEPKAVFGPLTVPTSQKDFYALSVNVQQTLWDFKGNASRYGASKMVLESKKYDTSRIRNLVALNFTLAYLDLLESERLVQVAQDEVNRLESHLKDAENLYNQGVITKNDLLQAQVRISDAKQRLVNAKNVRDVNASSVNNLISRPLTTEFQAVDVSETPLLPETVPDIGSAWKSAEQDRPELKIVDATLKSLNLQRESVRADYFPKFFASGGYGYTQNRFMTPNGNWSLILGMRFNIFNGGATTAEISKIHGQQQQLLEQRDKIADDIRLEVQRYMLNLQSARDRVAVTKGAVEQAKENARINRVKYTEGVGTATDVLDALTLLTVAETNHFTALYDLRKAEAGVLYSEGKDLSEVYK